MQPHVVVFGAGPSVEYGLPTLRSAFSDLGQFDWDRSDVSPACQRMLRRSGSLLWDFWNNNYLGLDLEKAFSLAWFQAANRMDEKPLAYFDFLQLVEPTLWHWFRAIGRHVLQPEGNVTGVGESAYRKVARHMVHLNATTFTDAGPIDYDSRRTIFVNLNWDPLFEVELNRNGVGVDYKSGLAGPKESPGPSRNLREGSAPFSAVVLKPHGSLNWYYRREGSTSNISFGDPVSEWLATSCSDSCYLESRDVSLMPPLPAKQRAVAIPWSRLGLSSEELERADYKIYPETWRTIHQALQACDELSIVGYSFPASDLFFALHVLSALRDGPRSDRRIHIVTPRKDPTRELEFRQKVFDAFQGDRRIWGQTDFIWTHAQEAAPWFNG